MNEKKRAFDVPSVQIVVATHKRYPMPSDTMYLPLQVGAEGKSFELGYTKDNEGDNISSRNSGFCELTGLYWAWKNLKSDYIGLVHYRRYLGIKKYRMDVSKQVLTYKELKPLLNQYSVFVPKKRHYYIESLYSHYAHTHYAEHLDLAGQILEKRYPEYLSVFDRVLKRTYGYMFNMFILRRDYLNLYCEWLFEILFELERQVDSSSLSTFHARLYGRISELLFNVWLEQMLCSGKIVPSEIKELDCIFMEKVDWVKKGRAFLRAKFFGIRYEGSF